MKKLVSILLAICVCLTFGIMLVACGEKPDEKQPADESKEMTREEISTTYKTIANEAYKKLNFNQTSDTTVSAFKATSLSTTSLPEIGDEVDVNSKDQKFLRANAISMVAMIEFVGNLYANSNFVITEKIVSFMVTMSMGSTEVVVSFSILPVIDKDNNRAYIEMTLEQNNSIVYYAFDLSFDFSTNTLNSMALGIFGIDANGDIESVNCQRMEGEKFYLTTTGTDEYNAQAKQLYSDFTTKKQEEVKLTADFSTEFNAYQQVSQKAYNDAANNN